MDDREQRIRELAYFIWLEEGRPEGQRSGTGEKRREFVEFEEAEQENARGEEPPGDYVTPLATLKRAPPSEGSF